jgi:hypothetical protein
LFSCFIIFVLFSCFILFVLFSTRQREWSR